MEFLYKVFSISLSYFAFIAGITNPLLPRFDFTMNVISWNVRGLNSPFRRSLLFNYLLSLRHSNTLICPQETKLSGFLLDSLTKSFVRNFNYSCTPANGTRGVDFGF
ncbi:hypothetical protein O6H91_13G022500 [Diphasiastrum complanatum]|uniref:Uncharacterized protein n=1 Tax=Diphasiastrum complanatum TaxID=34168 RepID=A0ACC2BSU2_DIPCM|nr:hypothetical protein O6H91_13G022500 [Diphasiastrum complanatum]